MSTVESDLPFRFVELGADTGGRLVAGAFTPQDPRFHRTLRYLRSAPSVIRDEATKGPDVLDPRHSAVVPRGYRTDGVWIWPLALEYYLEHHGVAPPGALADLIVQRGFWSPRVHADRVGQAHQALLRRQPTPFEPSAPIQFRFPPDVYDLLVTVGWAPGRDVGPVIDAWWPRAAPGQHDLPADLVAAGRSVLAEFGGLDYPVYGYTGDWRVVGFQLFPNGDPADPARLAGASARGGPLFALGTVPEWKCEIVLHPGLGVGTAGDVERYLGRDIDEALTSLIRGRAPAAAPRPSGGWLG
ncbi:SUKH-3 domain-containing protein [Dactylosporangium roseum]|uniref:SUKH-3 domain-containing protein n=1 Tax=Dactylosporangium roseum TaxID=47989 RepID=A0ABY5ZBS0_9ACTN|nr:SUKH-3 domain-containing protein [Dactylosporangium roseum]UWZ38902.1 SUKH-3 domain-containing protein [Dactylosporangium roseum]